MKSILLSFFVLFTCINNCFSQTTYYNSGKVKEVGNKQNGEFKSYYENGNLSSQGTYENGEKYGIWTIYYSNGNVKEKGFLDGESKVDRWCSYYENGSIKDSGFYLGNKPIGFWYYFYENGNLQKSCKIFDGQYIGEYVEYDEKGKVLFKENKEYKESSQNSEVEDVKYDEKGQLLSKGNKQNGEFLQYVSGNLILKSNYKNGEKDGEEIMYGEKDFIILKSNYKNGKKNGEYTTYDYNNHNIISKCTYINDTLDGDFIGYFNNKSNVVSGKMKVKKGKVLESISYWENGKIKNKYELGEGCTLSEFSSICQLKLKENNVNYKVFYYDEMGKLIGEHKCEGTNVYGVYISRHENNKIKVIKKLNGNYNEEIERKVYYQSGKIESFWNKEIYIWYYENGNVNRKIYKVNGVEKTDYYTKDGKLKN